MIRRFVQLLWRPFGRQSAEDVDEIGSASMETLHHVHPQPVKVGRFARFPVNETSGYDDDDVSDVVGDEPAGDYDINSFVEESSVRSNANKSNTDGWVTIDTSDPESRNGNDDTKLHAVVDGLPSTDPGSDAADQANFGAVGADSIAEEPSDELNRATLCRWPSVDLAYDADIDEMPFAAGKISSLRKDFSDVVNCGHEGKSSVHLNANYTKADRWETPYNSDTEPWGDDSDDEPSSKAKADLKSNAVVGQEDYDMIEATNVSEETHCRLDPAANFDRLPIADIECAHIDELPCADGKTTIFSKGLCEALNVGKVTGFKGDDVDAVGENTGLDAISRQSDLTNVSEVSADQYSVNDDWGPAFINDHGPCGNIDQELVRKDSSIRVVSSGKQSSGQWNVVSLSEKPHIASIVVSLSKLPCFQSNMISFDKQHSGQPISTTIHTCSTVFSTDHDHSTEVFTAGADKTSAAKEHPDERSPSVSDHVDSVEKEDHVEKNSDQATDVKETTSAVAGDRSNANDAKVQSDDVPVGPALNITPNTTTTVVRTVPVIDDEPVTWVKCGEDFDWDDADSDTDLRPPFRLLCGCFPRRRRLSIQLRRYRVKKTTKKGEVQGTEERTTEPNFVEVKCPRKPSSFKRFIRSH